jgi:hypothetical protein
MIVDEKGKVKEYGRMQGGRREGRVSDGRRRGVDWSRREESSSFRPCQGWERVSGELRMSWRGEGRREERPLAD